MDNNNIRYVFPMSYFFIHFTVSGIKLEICSVISIHLSRCFKNYVKYILHRKISFFFSK